MGRNSGGIRNNAPRKTVRNSAGKSLSKLMRQSYAQQMLPLLSRTVTVNGNGHPMNVGVSKAGNRHLINDAMMKDRGIHPSDLPDMDRILSGAEFVKKSGVYKPRKDNIARFYYYRVKLHGDVVYLNVAETDERQKGEIRHYRFLYAVKRKIK